MSRDFHILPEEELDFTQGKDDGATADGGGTCAGTDGGSCEPGEPGGGSGGGDANPVLPVLMVISNQDFYFSLGAETDEFALF